MRWGCGPRAGPRRLIWWRIYWRGHNAFLLLGILSAVIRAWILRKVRWIRMPAMVDGVPRWMGLIHHDAAQARAEARGQNWLDGGVRRYYRC